MKHNKNRQLKLTSILVLILLGAGCQTTTTHKQKMVGIYSIPSIEEEWIRQGQPLEFEGDLWYPQDGIEVFLDSEVYYIGEYKSASFFIDKQDVRPYNRLYTKFDKNQFRYFKKKKAE